LGPIYYRDADGTCGPEAFLPLFLPLALHLHTCRCSNPSPPSTNFPFQLPPCSCSHHCDHRRCLAATFGCLG
jgi:hypothetical protein